MILLGTMCTNQKLRTYIFCLIILEKGRFKERTLKFFLIKNDKNARKPNYTKYFSKRIYCLQVISFYYRYVIFQQITKYSCMNPLQQLCNLWTYHYMLLDTFNHKYIHLLLCYGKFLLKTCRYIYLRTSSSPGLVQVLRTLVHCRPYNLHPVRDLLYTVMYVRMYIVHVRVYGRRQVVGIQIRCTVRVGTCDINI